MNLFYPKNGIYLVAISFITILLITTFLIGCKDTGNSNLQSESESSTSIEPQYVVSEKEEATQPTEENHQVPSDTDSDNIIDNTENSEYEDHGIDDGSNVSLVTRVYGVIQVTFKDNVSMSEAESIIYKYGCEIQSGVKSDFLVYLLKVPEGKSDEEMVQLFLSEPSVMSAHLFILW